jgi:hypothetical protein
MRHFAQLFLCATAFAVAGGCDSVQDQTIEVALNHGYAPAGAIKVRLHELQNCQGSFQETTATSSGHARFTRTTEIGGVGVITDELSVCLQSHGTWTPLLSSVHGPAPALIEVTCELSPPTPQCHVAFDGRPQEDLGTERHDT